MTDHSAYLQLRKTARTAGLWYLAMAIIGVFCIMYIPKKIMVAGNAERSKTAPTTNPKTGVDNAKAQTWKK